MKQNNVNASFCPLCGLSNTCMKVQADQKKGTKADNSFVCWCMDLKLSAEMRAKLSERTKGNACLCEACLTKIASKKD